MKKFTTMLFTLIIFVFMSKAVFGCTVIVVGKKASVDGSVITSQTDCCQECRIHVVPERTFPDGATEPIYYGLQDVKKPMLDYGKIIGYIPQVAKTFAYIHSGYSHINEHQLAIGESTIAQREELKVNHKDGKQIMTVEQAMVIALERCKTARGAIKLITSLMEKYGFLPSCDSDAETLGIADPEKVWVLELFSVGPNWDPKSGKPGVIWAAERVPDDHAAIIPNWSIIKKIDLSKPDEFMASSNYKSFAIEHGWYDPKKGMPFIWQNVYSPTPREWATSRFWLFYSTIAPHLKKWPNRKLTKPFKGYDCYHQYVEPLSLYPFSAKPEKKLSVKDIITFQRSVFKGTIYDMTNDKDWFVPNGKGGLKKSPLTTPFPTKAMRELLDITWRRNVSRGGYGMVAQLRRSLPDPIGGVYWFFVDNQYVSTYVPIYCGVKSICRYWQVYDPDDFSEDSVRWAVDFVDNLLYLRWQDAIKDLKSERDPLENSFFRNQSSVENKALAIYRENKNKARDFLTNYTKSCMEKTMKMYIKLRNLLISKYTNNKQGS